MPSRTACASLRPPPADEFDLQMVQGINSRRRERMAAGKFGVGFQQTALTRYLKEGCQGSIPFRLYFAKNEAARPWSSTKLA